MDNNLSGFERFKQWLKAKLYIGVGKSLLIWFLAISIVPLGIVSLINYFYAYVGPKPFAEKTLVTISQLRAEYLNTLFKEVANYLDAEANLESNINFLKELKSDYNSSELGLKQYINSPEWQALTKGQRVDYQEILKKQEFYNIYYIDTNGDVLFSLKNENSLGTNIFHGEYANTLFSKTCSEILESGKMKFSDLEYYIPSNNTLSGFFCQPIRDKSGEIIGILAVQITTDRINKIIKDDIGLGETGETYIVGDDLYMRSNSSTAGDSAILKQYAKTEKTSDWKRFVQNKDNKQYLIEQELDKEESSVYPNIHGTYVLGIYRHLDYLENLGVNWVLIEEIEQSEAFAYSQRLSDIAKVAFIITIILVFFISLLVTKRIVTPIKKISAWAKQVAIGDLNSKNVKAPKNEVGEMVHTFNSLVESLKSYAVVSESAALGDYSKSVIIRSKDDILGKSMNQMVVSFKEVVDQANRIAKGDYSTKIVPRSDKDTLGVALYDMTKTLRETSKEMNEQDWLKTGLSQLESKLSGLRDIKKMTSEVISFLADYLDCQIGLIYVREGENLLLTATYALKDSKSKFNRFKLGEGLVGQAAAEGKRIYLKKPDNNVPEVNYGVDAKTPSNLLIIPFEYENEVRGVIQLGSFSVFDEVKQSFLDLCIDSIGIAINAVQTHSHVEKLLQQTQEQANELQAQQEELRQANEELEEQTKALKISEENLKHQQEELKVTNEELEERTNDLEIERDNIRKKNLELRKAQEEIAKKAKDLEIASKYKSEFLANMSHELRTPLNSILVLSQLLSDNKKGNLTDKEKEFAKTINSSGSDLLELINEILDLSKVESGKLDIHIEEMYLQEVNDFLIRTFEPVTNEKGLKLNFEIDKNVPEYIRTDSQRVLQIIKNLFSNAIKFTTTGSITLKVTRPPIDTEFSIVDLDPEKTVALSVIDTGIGIPKEKLQQIFEAFKQADGTTSRKYGGTGLGLTISRSFSELLGGEIHVASTEGQGSTFTLFLPDILTKDKVEKEQEKEEEKVQEKVATQEPGKEKKTIRKKKEKVQEVADEYDDIGDDRHNINKGDEFILIIEDDKNFCKVLIELAHEKHFKCMVALDGETGLHYADYHIPSAIILDIGLPGMDGYEVMEHLKNNSKTRHIPVHVISASDKSMDAMKMGAIGYLIKPVSQEKLEEVFNKIEKIISVPIRKALVVEDDTITRKSIVNLLDEGNVEIKAVESGEEAYDLLKQESFQCMILDLGLKELSGYELLEKIRKDKDIEDLPIIIYTGQELSKEDDAKLKKYADSIIIKGARSFERLLSEATLFLHQVQEEMPTNKQKMLAELNDREDVLSGKTILVVDDDMRNVFALSSVLEEQGLKVVVGKNGLEGLQQLRKNKDISLVLMDIMMPEMDGYEATREIRKNKKYEKLPIIALTAKAMKEDRAKCIAAGANDYLAKPVNTDKLISLLRVWLYSKK